MLALAQLNRMAGVAIACARLFFSKSLSLCFSKDQKMKHPIALLQGRDKIHAGKSRVCFADRKLLFEREADPPLSMRSLQTCHNFSVSKVRPVNSFLVDFGREFRQIN